MNELCNLEIKFQNYLMHSTDDIYQHIIATNKVPADVRLAIYGNAYRSRLLESLSKSYPALAIYLGCDAFEKLAFAYLDTYPSHYRSIRWFGDQLADFLRENSHYKNLPYLSELALFEWTMALVFDAADSDILLLGDMANIPPEAWGDMQLQAHPSVYRLNFSWNVEQIWQALLNDKIPPVAQLLTSKTSWLLWRNEYINKFSSLSEDEAWAIDAMMSDANFGEICEGLCQWVDEQDAALRAASLLKGWINSGLITQVKI